MNELEQLAYDRATDFRDKYGVGNYCAKQLTHILEMLEVTEMVRIKLIRTPFENLNLAGFIGYKYNAFIIVTNTNHTLGSERFTIAHEIFHLLNNRVLIKENMVIGEVENTEPSSPNEIMANAFAAELLMPKNDIMSYVNRLTANGSGILDESTIIKLQQVYGVGYLAITKRLVEVGIITQDKEQVLNQIVDDSKRLEELTIKLGYDNDLNIPSKVTLISQKDLETIKENYDNGNTSYDDLVRIFSYLGCDPEKFGYEDSQKITNEAIDFMKSLGIGKELRSWDE